MTDAPLGRSSQSDTHDPAPPTSPRIRLFTQATNPFAAKVAAALAIKSLRFERVVSRGPEDVARWSPVTRTLPVLEIDGERRADSGEILDWLEARYPDPPLYSTDARTADAQRRLSRWSDDAFAWYWTRWNAARESEAASTQATPFFARWVAALRRRLRPPSARTVRARVVERELADRLDDLVVFLGQRPYFHADEPSGADVSVYGVLSALSDGVIPEVAFAIESRPALAGYRRRMDGLVRAVTGSAERVSRRQDDDTLRISDEEQSDA